MIYQTLWPIVVSKTPDERGQAPVYLHPEDQDFVRILNDNLVNKYTAWMLSDAGTGNQIPLGQSDNFKFRLPSKPKPRLITIKANTPQQTRVRGYMMKFGTDSLWAIDMARSPLTQVLVQIS